MKKQMEFSNLYQRIKHEQYAPTAKERWALRDFLGEETSLEMPEAYAAIQVFCRFFDPTPENVALIDRFLQETADDYARQGALEALVEVWILPDEKYRTYVKQVLAKLNDWRWEETLTSAYNCATYYVLDGSDADMANHLLHTLDALKAGSGVDDVDYESDFIFLCRRLADRDAVRHGRRRVWFHTREDAEAVYDTVRTLLVEKAAR